MKVGQIAQSYKLSMQILDLYFEYPHNDWAVTNLFGSIANRLQQTYTDITFNIHKSNFLEARYRENSSIGSPHLFTIKNPANDKYIILSFWDKSIEICYNLFRDVSKLVQLISSAGINENEYNAHKNVHASLNLPDLDTIYTPFTYIPYTTSIAAQIEDIVKTPVKAFSDKIVFRGFLYDSREQLSTSFIDNNILILKDKLNTYDYLQEQYNQTMCISLNGAAEVAHRDIELFGLGKAVMRPEFNLKFNDPLVPGTHYISLGKFNFFHGQSFIPTDTLKNNICDAYLNNINNTDYINYIGKNAREWYLRNCTIDSATALFMSIVQIDRLFI